MVDIVTVDMETYYDKDYSLSKMTTEAYVRDPRFEVIGVAVKVNDQETDWYSGPDPGRFLRSLDWSDKWVLAHNCLTGDHEVRTPSGWVRLDVLRDGTPVAQWCPDTQAITFVVPSAVIRKAYSGPMHEWDTSYHKGVYTPEHRMYYTTPGAQEWRVGEARDVACMGPNNVYVPLGGIYEGTSFIRMSELHARIMEMLRADANLLPNANAARMRLKKEPKIARVRQLLSQAGWSYREGVRDGVSEFYIHSNPELAVIRTLLLSAGKKGYGSWILDLPISARQAILDEIQYWDGCRANKSSGEARQVVVHSADEATVDWIYELATMTGRSAITTKNRVNDRGFSRADGVLHHVAVRPRQRAKLIERPKTIHYDGMVYCVTVPAGAFLVRRNGATWVTGNCAFDGFILSHHFGIKPAMWLDTMSMARPKHANGCGVSLKALANHYKLKAKGDEVIHALGKRRADFSPQELSRYADYCIGDVGITWELFKILSQGFPPQELLAINTTIKMFTEPCLRLDKMRLEAHLLAERERKEKILAKLGGDSARSILNSNPKFAELLRALGVDPPTKMSKTTGKETYAFAKNDKGLLALQEHPDSRVRAVVGARLGTKSSIEETRTERFLAIADRGTLPIMLNYYGAHTGRFSGGDGINLQNLPRGGELRNAILAPDGETLIPCDLSQIEARILACIAGQDDLVQAFAQGRDVYSEFATVFYGRLVTKNDKVERFVGKTAILGLGYGLGWEKFKDTLAIGQGGLKVILSADQARNLVDTYRRTNSHIVKLWDQCNAALNDMYMGGCGELILDVVWYDQHGLTLPNGMRIDYPKLKRGAKGFEYVNNMRVHNRDSEQGWTKIYGGKMTENCLAADSEVLTARGWVRIADIADTDLLWDGVEWVTHGGLIEQPKQYTTVIDGVEMTPEHEVLTHDGWKAASSCAGLYRADFWLPDGSEVCGQQRAPFSMGVPMRLRDKYYPPSDRHNQAAGCELRLQEDRAYGHAQDDQASGLRGLEVHARPLPTTDTPSLQELRSEGHYGVPTVDVVRDFLGTYGSDLSAWPDPRSYRQRRELRAGELPVGDIQEADAQQAQQSAGGHADYQRADGYKSLDTQLSLEPQAVYDIRNAGPRTRFVVRGDSGPFIVHNCVQALARIVIVEMMNKIAKRYRVVLQVHDEIIISVPDADVPAARAFVEKVMRTPPKWLPALPVACESGVGKSYGDAK